MRCTCCDKLLSDYEATRKTVSHNEYLDVCNKCYDTDMQQYVPTVSRTDLSPFDENADIYDDYDGLLEDIDEEEEE